MITSEADARSRLVAMEAVELALDIADTCSGFDIECGCAIVHVDRSDFDWFDLSEQLDPEEDPAVIMRAVRYLDLRGRLVRHELYENIVRLLEQPEVAAEAEPA